MIPISEAVKYLFCNSPILVLFFHSFQCLWRADSVVYGFSHFQGEIGNGGRWINWSSVETRLKLFHLNIQFISKAEKDNYYCSKTMYWEKYRKHHRFLPIQLLQPVSCKNIPDIITEIIVILPSGDVAKINQTIFCNFTALKFTQRALFRQISQWSQGGFKAQRNTWLALQDTSILTCAEKNTRAANTTTNFMLWYWQVTIVLSH